MTNLTLTPIDPTPFGTPAPVDPDLTPPITLGTGDNQNLFAATTTGSLLHIAVGTSSVPDTSQNPPLKVARTLMFPVGTFGSQAVAEQTAAIYGITQSLDPCGYQPVGVLGVAKQSSQQESPQGDAIGLMGYSNALVDYEMTMYGAFLTAKRGIGFSEPNLTVCEMSSQNFGADDRYHANGNFKCKILALHSVGLAACAINFHKPTGGGQYEVGLGFTQAAGGSVIPTDAATYPDAACIALDADAVSGLRFGGEYTTAALNIPTVVGRRALVVADGNDGQIWGAVKSAGGSGYVVGDILTVSGGVGTPATLEVETVSAGAVLTVTVVDKGTYSTLPTNPASVTGGTGTGATFNLTNVGNAILVGLSERGGSTTNAYMVVYSSNSSTTDPIMWFGSDGATRSHYWRWGNALGEFHHYIAGNTSAFATAAGDAGIQIRSELTAYHISTLNGGGANRQNTFSVVNGKPAVVSPPAAAIPPKIAAFGVTPVARATAYTQTYATADKTHAARTAAALTDSTAGSVSTTVGQLPDPADAPATADALRDDLVANLIPALRNDLASLTDQVNKLRNDHLDTAQVVNSIIDDQQAYGWFQ